MTTIRARVLDTLAQPSLRALPLLPMLVLGALGWALEGRGEPPGAVLAAFNILAYAVVLVVTAILSYALAPKPPQPPKPSLEDFDFPTAEEGRPIPVVFGTTWISGANILWYGDLDTEAIRVKGGKK